MRSQAETEAAEAAEAAEAEATEATEAEAVQRKAVVWSEAMLALLTT
jgi:hypothetical protein